MNKLREKLLKAIQGMVIRKGMNEITDECEQITDDAMIKFFDWANVNAYKFPTKTTTTELLQIFKEKYYE